MLSDAKMEKRFVGMFGMPSEQFMSELEAELEQTSPEERAEFHNMIDQANAVLPQMNVSLDRMSEKLNNTRGTMRELRKSMVSIDDRLSYIEKAVAAKFPLSDAR